MGNTKNTRLTRLVEVQATGIVTGLHAKRQESGMEVRGKMDLGAACGSVEVLKKRNGRFADPGVAAAAAAFFQEILARITLKCLYGNDQETRCRQEADGQQAADWMTRCIADAQPPHAWHGPA